MGELSSRFLDNIKSGRIKVIANRGNPLIPSSDDFAYGELTLQHKIDYDASNNGFSIYKPTHKTGRTVESFLDNYFSKMEGSTVGANQLRGVLNSLDNPSHNLFIRLGDSKSIKDTSFYSEKDKYFINLNISGKNELIEKPFDSFELQVPHYGISHRVSVPTSNGISPIEAVLIQERDDPFHIAIGHEINHLKHREDGSNIRGIRTDFRENKESKEKKDSSRVNNKGVWPNPEEHRNVFGLADPGSELNARMETGLHFRYPYDTDEPFIEPVKTILRNAVKSERHIEGTTLPPLSVEEWVRRLVDLRDRLDALPSAPFLSFPATTTSSRGSAASPSSSSSSSSSTMPSSSSSLSSSKEHLTDPAAFAGATDFRFNKD